MIIFDMIVKLIVKLIRYSNYDKKKGIFIIIMLINKNLIRLKLRKNDNKQLSHIINVIFLSFSFFPILISILFQAVTCEYIKNNLH